jgi:two-component system sensor histidine kinase YesM
MKNPLGKIFKFYKDLPIRQKMLLIFNIQIIIPLFFIGYMSYWISANTIRDKSIDYSQDILRTIELRLMDSVNNLNHISQDLMYEENIYNDLRNDGSAYNPNDPLNVYITTDSIQSTMKKFIISRNEIQSICVVSRDGKPKYSADNNSSKISIRDLINYKEMSEKARQGHGKPMWYFDFKDSNVNNIFLVRTLYDRDNYKDEIGLLVMLIKKEFFQSVYLDLLTEDMKNIVVISEDNHFIVSRDSDYAHLYNRNIQKQFLGKRGWMKDEEGGNLISYVSMEQPRWKIVAFIPLDSLYKEISDLRLWMIVFCIATVIILSLISRIIAFDLIKPIKLLVDGMKKVQKGKTVGVKVDRNDELGFITKSFNEMANEIEHLITWIYREQITRKEAQLKALQSQINPHFLFNTLESINWMAQLNNVPEISETVTAFSSLMEASIGRDDKLITLREELTYIDNYISILKKRFEDGIQLIKHIETEKILEINIPRLLIQPLIENAVYHGIDRSSRTGIINLNVYTKEDILFIEVMDNGMGIDEEELRILNKNLSMDNDTYFRTHVNKDRKSIGMENVNRRIKLFYGERFGIKIESETGEYTKVVVSIPANTAEADGGSAEETGPRDL